MFILLENRDDRWVQADDTTAYETIEEARDIGKNLELFDSIVVEFKEWI